MGLPRAQQASLNLGSGWQVNVYEMCHCFEFGIFRGNSGSFSHSCGHSKCLSVGGRILGLDSGGNEGIIGSRTGKTVCVTKHYEAWSISVIFLSSQYFWVSATDNRQKSTDTVQDLIGVAN